MPKSSSLYAARMREYADLKISRWYPNFLDYLALPAYLVEETVETARAVLDKETSEAATTAANIKNLMEGNKG